jgi:hypothetical protein
LVGFKGVLQVDGYAGYRALGEKGDVSLAFCWAHVRRRLKALAAHVLKLTNQIVAVRYYTARVSGRLQLNSSPECQ